MSTGIYHSEAGDLELEVLAHDTKAGTATLGESKDSVKVEGCKVENSGRIGTATIEGAKPAEPKKSDDSKEPEKGSKDPKEPAEPKK